MKDKLKQGMSKAQHSGNSTFIPSRDNKRPSVPGRVGQNGRPVEQSQSGQTSHGQQSHSGQALHGQQSHSGQASHGQQSHSGQASHGQQSHTSSHTSTAHMNRHPPSASQQVKPRPPGVPRSGHQMVLEEHSLRRVRTEPTSISTKEYMERRQQQKMMQHAPPADHKVLDPTKARMDKHRQRQSLPSASLHHQDKRPHHPGRIILSTALNTGSATFFIY